MRLQALAVVSALAIAGLSASAAGAVPVANGSFEDVQITSAFSSNPADIPGWTHSGNVGDALIWNATFSQCCGGTNSANTGDGNQFVTMGGGFGPTGSSAWSQTLSGLTVGQTYVVDFKTAAEGETNTQQLTVGMTSGSLSPSELVTTIPSNLSLFWQNWGADSYDFVANATSGTLQFSVTNEEFDVGLDSVSVSAAGVPEAATWTLMLIGVGMIGAGARLARRKDSLPSAA